MTNRRRILFTLSAGVLAFVFLEVFFGLAVPLGGMGQGQPEQTMDGSPAIMMHGNPFLMWELSPGERTETDGIVHINKDGFRDKERAAPTGARALVLGDSSIYGFGVTDQYLFTTLLERALGAEFINGGVPGYSSTQALNLLWGRGLALEPELLIVATLWSDNNFDSFVDSEQLSRYAAWRRNPEASIQAVLEHSAVYRAMEFALKKQTPGRVSWMELRRRPATGNRRVPIADYARNLAEFCRVMADRDGGVVFVVLPNRHDLSGGVQNPPWTPYRTVMRNTAKACGAPIVELPEVFAARAQPFLFIDEMHPSRAGHALMAETIATTLKHHGWPQSRIRVHAPLGAVDVPADDFEGRGLELGLFGGDQRH